MRSSSPATTWIARSALAGLAAGSVAGAVHGAAASLSAGLIALLVADIGLGAVAGSLVGLSFGVISLLWRGPAWPARALGLAATWVLLGPVAVVSVWVGASRVASPLFTTIAVVGLALSLFAVGWPLADLFTEKIRTSSLGALMPESGPAVRRRHGVWGALWVVLAALAGLLSFALTDLPIALGWLSLIEGIVFLTVGLGLLVVEDAHAPSRWVRRAALVTAASTLVGGGLFVGAAASPGVGAALVGEGGAPAVGLRLLWSLLDGDGDGYASVLGGTDCDDGNAAIHPGANDVPHNGIDEDCSGWDAGSAGRPHLTRAVVSTTMARRPRSILLISSEAFRADAADLRPEGSTPNLAALAREGTFFERAHSAGPATHLTLGSLFKGRMPSRLRWKLDARPPRELSKRPTLATLLRQHGWTTHAFVTHWVHQNVPSIRPGFETFALAPEPNGSSDPLVAAVIAKLRVLPSGHPLFLWIHLNEPHWPHQSGHTETLESGYKAEVHEVDRHIGELIAAFRERGLWDDTAVVIFGDHAEALGAHGVKTHGVTLYESEVHIPMLLRVPGLGGLRSKTLVSTVDIMPTVLDLAGVGSPLEFDGQSLVPLAKGESLPPRPVFAESYNPLKPPAVWLAVYWEQYKLLRRLHTGRDELFDLSKDPAELTDLNGTLPKTEELLRATGAAYAIGGTWK